MAILLVVATWHQWVAVVDFVVAQVVAVAVSLAEPVVVAIFPWAAAIQPDAQAVVDVVVVAAECQEIWAPADAVVVAAAVVVAVAVAVAGALAAVAAAVLVPVVVL